MEKSSFFNSVAKDRRYSAEDWSAYFASFISNGVFAQPSDSLQVMANTGMSVSVKPGISFVNGYRYQNTTALTKTLAVADGISNRIDRIVVRWSLPNRNITVTVLQGAPATIPTAPPLTRDAETYELALADIYIGAGITAISQSGITDHRPDSEFCGFVTGVIEQLDFETLAVQFDAWMNESETEFKEWFQTIKDILDDNTAGHLQNEITALENTVEEHWDNTVPTTRKVNNKALNADISLTPADVSAAPAHGYGTSDLTAGSSSLATGKIYCVYE